MTRSFHTERGAVLVEFALSASLIFSVMFGSLWLGIIGLGQMQADGAAYSWGHLQALNGVTAAATPVPHSIIQTLYPNIPVADITSQPEKLPASAYKVPVDYQLTNTDARHGGYSLILPTQLVTSVQHTFTNYLVPGVKSSLITSGFGVEPIFQEIGDGSDVSGTADFTGRVNYFLEGENTPPYFFAFTYMKYCNTVNDGITAPNTPNYNACNPAILGQPNPVIWDAPGLAERLDPDNWGMAANGVMPTQVFAAVLMHQQAYAKLGEELVNATGAVSPALSNGQMALAQLRSTGFMDPTSSTNILGCMYTQWDQQHQANYTNVGQVGSNPLYPDRQCG